MKKYMFAPTILLVIFSMILASNLTLAFSDNFNRANSSTIGNGWQETESGGNLDIVNQEVRADPSADGYTVLTYDFGASQMPSSASFRLNTSDLESPDANVVIFAAGNFQASATLFNVFYDPASQIIGSNDPNIYGNASVPLNHSALVELKNINFITFTYDFYVDGVLIDSDIPFNQNYELGQVHWFVDDNSNEGDLVFFDDFNINLTALIQDNYCDDHPEALFCDDAEGGNDPCDLQHWGYPDLGNSNSECLRTNMSYSTDRSYSGTHSLKSPTANGEDLDEGQGWIYGVFSYLNLTDQPFEVDFKIFYNMNASDNFWNPQHSLESGNGQWAMQYFPSFTSQDYLECTSGTYTACNNLTFMQGWNTYNLTSNGSTMNVYLNGNLQATIEGVTDFPAIFMDAIASQSQPEMVDDHLYMDDFAIYSPSECVPDYYCSHLNACDMNNTQICDAVSDNNACGIPYNPSNYTDFNEGCVFVPPSNETGYAPQYGASDIAPITFDGIGKLIFIVIGFLAIIVSGVILIYAWNKIKKEK